MSRWRPPSVDAGQFAVTLLPPTRASNSVTARQPPGPGSTAATRGPARIPTCPPMWAGRASAARPGSQPRAGPVGPSLRQRPASPTTASSTTRGEDPAGSTDPTRPERADRRGRRGPAEFALDRASAGGRGAGPDHRRRSRRAARRQRTVGGPPQGHGPPHRMRSAGWQDEQADGQEVGGNAGDDQQVEDLVVAQDRRHWGRGGAARRRPLRSSRRARRPRAAARRSRRGGRTAAAWPPRPPSQGPDTRSHRAIWAPWSSQFEHGAGQCSAPDDRQYHRGQCALQDQRVNRV
jgi:hypothetical protein